MKGRRLPSPTVIAVSAMAAGLLGLSCGNGERVSTHEVYVRLECGKCHGAGLEGTRTAPPLTGLASRWDRAGLEEYLRHPQRVTERNPHIALRNERYPLKMPSFADAAGSELSELADFLLSQ
jgi:hypothetical protein